MVANLQSMLCNKDYPLSATSYSEIYMGCKGGKIEKYKLNINWKLESKSEILAYSELVKKNKAVKRI